MTERTECYLCRGARTMYGRNCANCAGNGYVLTETERRCWHCAAPLLRNEAALCVPCMDREMRE